MIEGVAQYHGEQEDGTHEVRVRVTVLHADQAKNYRQNITLRLDPNVFEGCDSSDMVQIVHGEPDKPDTR